MHLFNTKGCVKMTSTKRLSLICYGITLVVFLVIYLWGALGSITGDEMGYSILSFYLIMPFTSFVMSLIMGMKNVYMKWLFPVIFGILGFAIPLMVFGSFDWISLFFSFIPAMSGMGVGVLVQRLRLRK